MTVPCGFRSANKSATPQKRPPENLLHPPYGGFRRGITCHAIFFGTPTSSFSNDRKIRSDTARVKTLRTSKRWENIPKNRIKTGAKWVTYLFLRSFCYVGGEIFHAPLYFWSFYTAWIATIFLFVSSLIQTLRATRKSAPGGFFITFGNLPKASVDFAKARASLREIPEDASVRKPPLKRKSAAATDTNARE